jgi:hypothetical protein
LLHERTQSRTQTVKVKNSGTQTTVTGIAHHHALDQQPDQAFLLGGE